MVAGGGRRLICVEKPGLMPQLFRKCALAPFKIDADSHHNAFNDACFKICHSLCKNSADFFFIQI